jgi:hypothetical protein
MDGEMEIKLNEVHYFGRVLKEGTKEYDKFMNGDL